CARPQIVVAVWVVFAFAVHWHLFPATGYTYLTASAGKNLRSVALPVIVLALPELAAYLRLLRADMIAPLQEDYITMARAKGLSTPYILLRHALRPSSFSVLTVGGLNVGRLIGGASL